MEIEASYQEEREQSEPAVTPPSFATIRGIHEDGLSLVFDGETEPSQKHYRANLYGKFAVGQRVYIAKDNGTYVVLFPIGVPGSADVVADASRFHAGDTISFFGGSESAKKTVSNLSGSVNAATVGNKLNTLLNALRAYGLIG